MRDFEKEARTVLPCAYACSGVQLGRECHPECPKRALVPAVASALRAAEAAGFERGRDAAAEKADAEAARCSAEMNEPTAWPEGPKTDEQMANRRAWVVRRGGAKELAKAIRAMRPDAGKP